MADPSPGVGHADSIDSRDDSNKPTEKKKKSRRPANTAFRQQRLKAWQPILTPKTVLPLFFAIGIIFAPIGGLLIYASSTVQMIQIDYSKCDTAAPNATEFGGSNTAMSDDDVTSAFKDTTTPINAQWRRETTSHTYHGNYSVENITKCVLEFTIPEDMGPPVLFYYQLTNFYQNHRRYVSSYFDKQLKGDKVTTAAVASSSCTPLTVDKEQNGLPYYPCGLIANSLFNDTFESPYYKSGNPAGFYNMSDSDIAWSSDNDLYGNLPDDFDYTTIVPPPNWRKQYRDGKYSQEAPPPNLKDNGHFMVWMRTAGLPTFSKLYMRNDNTTMKKGTYSVEILSEFPTTEYQGTKSIIITTKSVIGGKNPFLGIAYVVVGGICIVLGAIFTVTHLIKPRKLGDHTYLSWNKVSGNAAKPGSGGPAVGMSTGRDLA